jgi:uncharacterized protein (TIGR03437 family)
MRPIVEASGKGSLGKRACGVFVLWATTVIALPAQTLTTLHVFGGLDGKTPYAELVQATNGDFYGTTSSGGANANGGGTVFKITTSGTLTTLYSFCSLAGCTDGAGANKLIQATDGDFYGTTSSGGANSCIFGTTDYGCGTVFQITPSGTLTTLYSFCAQSGCPDGETPNAGLVQGTDGNFYGTTSGGSNGSNLCQFGEANGCGTVFKITPSGTLTTLYRFCALAGCTDGSRPRALVQATDGDFYGTTSGGEGDYGNGPAFFGTVFKITPSGTLTTLYRFCALAGCPDGEYPEAGLIQGTDGNFYGTTAFGGTNGGPTGFGAGTVFKITPSGTLTTLYRFCALAGCPDGEEIWAGLVQATDGDFYGTTRNGGANGGPSGIGAGGTVFKMTPSGTLTTLYNFCSLAGCPDGETLNAGLVQGTDGNFYGTTVEGGGSADDGTIFSLSVGLGPAVPAVNAEGVLNSGSYTTQGVAPGSIVSIFGTNLAASMAAAGAIPLPTALSDVTSVTFNNIPAGLYFVSEKQINAQLPFNVLPSSQGGTAKIVVTRGSGTSAPQTVTVVPASPGIFTTTSDGLGQAFAYDNTTVALAAPAGTAIGSLTTAPISVSSGDALIIACTGLGPVNPSIDDYVAASDGILRYTVLTPTVLIGGVPATPIYSVLSPQFVSEYQIGVTPSANTPTGDAVSLQIQIAGVTTTDQVTIAVAP